MRAKATILVLSDVHYAGTAEQQRGSPETAIIRNPLLRAAVRCYRHFIWRRDPFAHNHLLDVFMDHAGEADLVIANGDYSCDTEFVGVGDQAAFESAHECLDKLRDRYDGRLRLVLGDHELGKMSLFGGRGGMRLMSWARAQEGLGLQPFWTEHIGRYVLMGVTSSLLAYPIYQPEALPEEQSEWEALRALHLARVRETFRQLAPEQRLLLFCHDPTALPFLWHEKEIRSRLSQVEGTIIGHLHSKLFLWQSRVLAGMPTIRVLGNSIRRMSAALHEARYWKDFQVELCPSLAGIELLRDGGYCRITLDLAGEQSLELEHVRLPS